MTRLPRDAFDHLLRTGDAQSARWVHKQRVGDGELALRDRSAQLVEFVCMAKHAADVFGGSRTLLLRGQLAAYCARGADQNHEWIRVPPTPANEITTGIMEERPPEPVVRLPR